MALQIQHDDTGKITGVLYADQDGNQQVQKARIVCVAGNSFESPLALGACTNMPQQMRLVAARQLFFQQLHEVPRLEAVFRFL